MQAPRTAAVDDCFARLAVAELTIELAAAGSGLGSRGGVAHYDRELMAVPNSRFLFRGRERVAWRRRGGVRRARAGR